MEGKEKKRLVEWGKNALILLLTISALWLMSRSDLGAGFAAAFWQEREEAAGSAQRVQEADQRVWPVRMAVQNSQGRYGVQYDDEGVETLFSGQLGTLLGEVLAMTHSCVEVPESLWQEILLSQRTWVYYDFLGSMPLPHLAAWLGAAEGENQNLNGFARAFLLTVDGEGREALYCYSPDRSAYYLCQTTAPLAQGDQRLAAAASHYTPNGAIFAMEDAASYATLWPYTLVLPQLPTMPGFSATHVIDALAGEELDALLRELAFLPRAVSYYQAADGLVVREGMDTLRLQTDGSVTFSTAADAQQARYPLGQWSVESAAAAAKSILDGVLPTQLGQARSYCMGSAEGEDGTIRVTFGYLLNGAQVHAGSGGWGAEFLFRDGMVESYTIRLHRYEALDTPAVILPERQALAALSALSREGSELLLCYTDSGTGTMGAGWIAAGS